VAYIADSCDLLDIVHKPLTIGFLSNLCSCNAAIVE